MVGQVAEFQSTKPDHRRDLFALGGRILASDLGFIQTLPRSVCDDPDQVGETQHAALPGLERLPIGSVHRPEGDVLQLHVVGHYRCAACRAEYLIEMQPLAGIHHVEHQVVTVLRPLLQRGEIGRRVQIRPIRPGQQEGWHLLLIRRIRHIDDDRSVGLDRDVVVGEPIDEWAQPVVDRALTAPQVEFDAEVLKIPPLLFDGYVVKVLPQRQIPGTAPLQVKRGPARSIRLPRIGVGPLHRSRVHLREIIERDRRLGRVRAGEVRVEVGQFWMPGLQLGDQLTDRHPPIPKMDVSVDIVTHQAEQALQALTDDGSPQMPDVHRLGHVGAAVVDEHLQRRIGSPNPKLFVIIHGLGVVGENLVGHGDVDKPGPGDVEGSEQRVVVDRTDHLGGECSRIPSRLLRCPQGTVALVLRQLGTL